MQIAAFSFYTFYTYTALKEDIAETIQRILLDRLMFEKVAGLLQILLVSGMCNDWFRSAMIYHKPSGAGCSLAWDESSKLR